MKPLQNSTLRNLSAGTDISTSVAAATSAFDRIVGWLRVSTLQPDNGLWFARCSTIHTIGMRTAIDVILLDRHSRVVALHSRVRPNRLWLSHRRAASIIEMGPGFLDDTAVALGDELALVDTKTAAPAACRP